MTKKKAYQVAWSCPSNIALIKYWGKKPGQLPINPSLSFGLQNARTRTSISLQKTPKHHLQFYFDGKESSFGERVKHYLNSLHIDFPWIQDYSFVIESKNSFPHSAGIASSASAFGALALCLADLDRQIEGKTIDQCSFLNQASRLARLGSGSASRSMFKGFALWGKSDKIPGSTDCHAIPVQKDIHPVYYNLRDAVLLVDPGKKKVSSSAGHQLMNKHLFKGSRILQANQNLIRLLQIMKSNDLSPFFEIIENEALSLHALMMSSMPSFILLKPESLKIIEKIRTFRKQSAIPVGFTIDAGSNIHLLYFDEHTQKVHDWIKNDLINLLENKAWLDDRPGDGPAKLE